MAKTKEQRLAEVHSKAMQQFSRIIDAVRDEREQCREDRRFYSIAGAQWEGALADQYENKPKFEVNKTHLAVLRIVNEYRNNRITVDFVSKEGEEYDSLADLLDGMYRADEDDSCAQEAYDNAFEEGASGGMGAFRLINEYEDEEDEDNEKQRIRFLPIFDADSCVFFDIASKRQDKSDAKHCFVLTSMPTDDFIAEYNEDPADWENELQDNEWDWSTPDIVWLAEYYTIEQKTESIHYWQALDGSEEKYRDKDFEDDPALFETLTAIGSKEIRTRKIKVKKCHKYIMSGNSVLEDAGYIAGNCLPIVPMYGKRWFVDGIERCMGHVRLAKDAQRLKNMQLSKLGEISALSALEKPIFTAEQMAGHREIWTDDNIKNYPYLLINSMTDAAGNAVATGPVGYTKPPQVPPAMAALLQITEQDMQDLLGNQQAAEQLQPNISGKAVELIQNRLDMQAYIYMSNMAKAIRRAGEVWLSMAKDIYVEAGRKVKTLSIQKKVSHNELMKPVINQETGEKEYENDISKAKCDISVHIGPSSESKRASIVRAVTGMLQMTQNDPETTAILISMAMMNMEGEGIEDIRKYFRHRLVRMNVIKPNEQEAQELAAELQAQQQPGPEQQYMQAAAMEAMAKAEKARADTMLTAAKTEETRVKTVESLSALDQRAKEETLKTYKELRTMQQQPVAPPMAQPTEMGV